jgi:hypothetical protein
MSLVTEQHSICGPRHGLGAALPFAARSCSEHRGMLRARRRPGRRGLRENGCMQQTNTTSSFLAAAPAGIGSGLSASVRRENRNEFGCRLS